MKITQGTTKPPLTVRVSNDVENPAAQVIALTEAVSVTVVGVSDGVEVLRRPATTVDEHGNLTYAWTQLDTAVARTLEISIEIDWPTGLQVIELTDQVEIEPRAGARLVTVADLQAHMSGVTFSGAQLADAEAVLRGLTRGLERRLLRGFVEDTVTERVYAAEDGYALVTRSPVRELLSVDNVIDLRYYRIMPGGVLGLTPLCWATVTYRGGGGVAQDDLADVKLAILEKAAAYMTNRHDDTVSVKNLDTREPVANPAPRWTPDDVLDFDRLRRRVVL